VRGGGQLKRAGWSYAFAWSVRVHARVRDADAARSRRHEVVARGRISV
jgi:hypothetical protein